MTTIACNNECIATDTQYDGGTSISHESKIWALKSKNGYSLFGGSGALADVLKFLKWYSLGKHWDKKPQFNKEWYVIELTKDGMIIDWDDYMVPKEYPEKIDSCGSGSSWAIGAMEAGASPIDAVSIASKHDTDSGGLPEMLNLDDKKGIKKCIERTMKILDTFGI